MLLDAITLALKLTILGGFALLLASLLSANWRLWRGHREEKSLADAPAGRWQGPPFDRMDAALIKPFIHDLEDMCACNNMQAPWTSPLQMRWSPAPCRSLS